MIWMLRFYVERRSDIAQHVERPQRTDDAIRAGMEWAIPGSGKRPHVPCETPGCRLPWTPQDKVENR